MLSREEWEEFREVRPRTPFESKLARPNAKIRTGEPLHMVSQRTMWYLIFLMDEYLNLFSVLLMVISNTICIMFLFNYCLAT